jgi:hypothetical protein
MRQQGVPIILTGPEPSRFRRRDDPIPQRIRVCMEVLAFFTRKTGKRIVPGHEMVASEQFDGEELDVEERKLFRDSVQTLNSYVIGKYQMSKPEQAKLRNKKKDKDSGLFIIIMCPNCGGGGYEERGSKCVMCKGRGKLQTKPV